MIILVIILVLFGSYYLVTGDDPLGLFTEQAPSTPSAVVESEGDWWHVYFTDPQSQNFEPGSVTLSGTIPEKLIEHINRAERTIHIASFEFNLTPVAEALIAAHERGIEVQWVTDDEHGIEADTEEGNGQFAMLKKAGIAVRDDGRSALMHNKFWIFDEHTVWTGSTNITINGNFRNNNNVLTIEVPEVAQIYEREFTEMWNGAFGPTSPSTWEDQSVYVNDTEVQVLFAAEDDVISKLIPLISDAQRTLRFMAFSFTHDEMGTMILNRAESGVDVQGIFETRGSETAYSEMPRLYCAGVSVRQDGNPGTFHHKVLIIDEQILVTGSLNFSVNANESNDENVIIIHEPNLAAQYLQEFERRWSEATEPDQADMNCQAWQDEAPAQRKSTGD